MSSRKVNGDLRSRLPPRLRRRSSDSSASDSIPLDYYTGGNGEQRLNGNGHLNNGYNSHLQNLVNRTQSRVTFTIGDSSDCDSVSGSCGTPASSSIGPEGRRKFSYTSPEDEEQDGVEDETADIPSGVDDVPAGFDDRWRKYHFQVGDDVQDNVGNGGPLPQTNGVAGGALTENYNNGTGGRAEVRRSSDDNSQILSPTTSTGIMIPSYRNDASIARLADIESCDGSEDGDEAGLCAQGWGKWRILVACAIIQLFSALMVSLQAPFYPLEAEKKQANATEYGFVFGVFELTVFIVAPFYGSNIHKWNQKVVFHVGIVIAAVSSIAFGLLEMIPNGKYFIAASALVRALEALGESAVVTSTFYIVASAFPDSVASTFAIVEAFYSIGLISGPIAGSVLYHIGGFSLPFMVVGGALLLASLISLLILPSAREISEYQQGNEPLIISSYKSFRLIGVAGVAISAFCIILGSMSISFLQATLEPHLRQFDISQLTTGAILVINGGVYTITAPFFGLLCDKIVQLKLVTFCGLAILVCGFAMIGPVPIFYFPQQLWIICVGLTLQGLGLGAVLVSSFVSILHQVIKKGFPDSPSTYGLVSSLWTSMFSLGAFVGPSISGILFDAVGFPNGTVTVIGLALIMMCFLLIFMFISDTETESIVDSGESEPLLNNSTAVTDSVYSIEQHFWDLQQNRQQQRDRSNSQITYGSM